MIFVKSADLKVGMRVAKPVYNRLGVLLYDRNSTLTAQAVASVKNFGLIGLFILEPAEPAPPITHEEAEFERFQTIYMFRVKDVMDHILNGEDPKNLTILAETIIKEYGHLDHRFLFAQNLRSIEDYNYKHSLNVAILCSMICSKLALDHNTTLSIVIAALLHDVGMLSLRKETMEKSELSLTKEDLEAINRSLKYSYELLQPTSNPYNIPGLTLRILLQYSQFYHHPRYPVDSKMKWSQPAMILQVANAFDSLTAMNPQQAPFSDIAAIRYLNEYESYYDSKVLKALTDSIYIVPRGCCVELSSGDKGMVIDENPDDFMSPVVLMFSNNRIINLDDPAIASQFQIVDIMKTMDNRIQIDHDTLNHFASDPHLKEQLTKIHAQRNARKNKKRQKLT